MSKKTKKPKATKPKRHKPFNNPLTKIFEFEMTYKDVQIKESIEAIALRTGIDVMDMDYTPIWIALEAYDQQNMIIALKCDHIQDPDYWEISAQGVFLSADGTKSMGIPFYIELPKMGHVEVMNGSKHVKVNRGAGIKTRWAGIDAEITSHYEANLIAGFELQYTQIKMLCRAKFHNLELYHEHLKMLRMRDMDMLTNFVLQDRELIKLDARYKKEVEAAKAKERALCATGKI